MRFLVLIECPVVSVKHRLTIIVTALTMLTGIDATANSGPAQSGLFAPANNAMTAAANPAGLTRLERTEWLGQLVIFGSESTFETTSDSYPGVTVEEDDGSLFVPFVYYARPLNEKWTVGASFTAPGGFGEDLDDNSPGRYLVDEWNLIFLSLSPAAGYRVNDRFSVGGAVNINYTLYEFESAVFNPEPTIGDGRMEIDADDITVTFQMGLLYEFSPRTRVGFNYRTESDPSLSDTPSFNNLGPIRQAALDQAGILDQKLVFKTTMPRIVGAGIYHELENGTALTLDGLWLEFSEFGISEFRIGDNSISPTEQDFEDVWAFSTGVSYPLNKHWTIKGGFAYTTQFIKDQNRTQAFRMDQIWGVGGGAEYNWGKDKVLGLNLNYYDLGDGPVETDVPILGTLNGKFTERYAIGIDFTFRWLR